MIRVLLADDHSVLREGMALILSVEDDIEVVGQACHGREALDLATDLVPDVVLMDIQMPVMDGIEATRELLAKTPATKVVILTTFEREDYLFDAVVAGASGFLLKNTEAEQIVEAVRAVHAGQALLSPERRG
jgi:DNA-binding NarL/FixJ family response regulator